ncbi:hypothetical protein U3516DRAFT_742660 [Neocallimastix sp. 'constans']
MRIDILVKILINEKEVDIDTTTDKCLFAVNSQNVDNQINHHEHFKIKDRFLNGKTFSSKAHNDGHNKCITSDTTNVLAITDWNEFDKNSITLLQSLD